jgi:hypothetical protein
MLEKGKDLVKMTRRLADKPNKNITTAHKTKKEKVEPPWPTKNSLFHGEAPRLVFFNV